MVDYMRAEFYKVLHRKYTYWFLLVMLAGAGLMVAGFAYTNARGNELTFGGGVKMLALMLSMGLYCALLTADIVFSDQYKFNTLKNEVSYGISRSCIYLGKLLVSAVVSIVSCAIIIGFYVALCALFLPHAPTADAESVRLVLVGLLNALPLWLGAQAVALFCMTFIKGSTMAAILFVVILMLLPTGLKLLGMLIDPVFMVMRDYTLMAPFDSPDIITNSDALLRCLAAGAGWFAGSTVLGLLLFRKREIN